MGVIIVGYVEIKTLSEVGGFVIFNVFLEIHQKAKWDNSFCEVCLETGQ